VLDEYPKIDFFVWRENAKKYFRAAFAPAFVTLFVRENIILFFGILLFFFQKIGISRAKKIVEKIRMDQNDAWKIWCHQIFLFFHNSSS